uniref:Globin family profile domain-containing protein n=1 Tax=Maylandia zebra TaxID=106582 RepID=A0A3P9D4Y1_9CICH
MAVSGSKSKIETLYFRLLTAYQWTQRHFQLFGNLSTNALRVDPDNFRVCDLRLFPPVIMMKHAIIIFGPQVFAPDVQMTWQTFLAVVVSALGKQYH